MQELLRNISRVPEFLVVVMVGGLTNLFKPLTPLLQKPSTALLLLGLLTGGLVFIFLTLEAMLGRPVHLI